jgi:hypothetical protein
MKKSRDNDPRFLAPKIFSENEICRATDFVRDNYPDIFFMIQKHDRGEIVADPKEWRDKMSQLVTLLKELKIADNLSDLVGLRSAIRAEIKTRLAW